MVEEKQKQEESDNTTSSPADIVLASSIARTDVAFSRWKFTSMLESALGSGYGLPLPDIEKLSEDEMAEVAVQLVEHMKTKIADLAARLDKEGAQMTVFTALSKSKSYAKKLST